MKFLIGLYVIMILIVFVNLISEFILDGQYSAIASWIIVMMFFFETIFFANARYYLSRQFYRFREIKRANIKEVPKLTNPLRFHF